MQIKINLPEMNYEMTIPQYLKQLELAVHHAQKAYQSAEKDIKITENAAVWFELPAIEAFLRTEGRDENELYEESQNIVLVLNLE